MRKLILILNGTRFVSARVLLQSVVIFGLALLFRLIAPTLAQLTISARWWRLLLVGPTFLLSWHALLSTFAPRDEICSDSSRLMALLAVRLSRHALLHCSLDAAGFARFVRPTVFFRLCVLPLLLLLVLRLSFDMPSKKKKETLTNAFKPHN